MLSSQFAEQLPPTLDHNQLVSNMKYVLALPPEYLDVVIAIYVDAMRTMAVIGTAMFVLVFASGAMMRPIDLDQVCVCVTGGGGYLTIIIFTIYTCYVLKNCCMLPTGQGRLCRVQ
jgi:hypothetical protein